LGHCRRRNQFWGEVFMDGLGEIGEGSVIELEEELVLAGKGSTIEDGRKGKQRLVGEKLRFEFGSDESQRLGLKITEAKGRRVLRGGRARSNG